MGFHQQLEAEEMNVRPKAAPLGAGLPNFHPELQPGQVPPSAQPHLRKNHPNPAKLLIPVFCWLGGAQRPQAGSPVVHQLV